MPVPQRDAYDRVIDNDWDKYKSVLLFKGGSTLPEIIRFAMWCGQFVGKLHVAFPGPGLVRFTKARQR